MILLCAYVPIILAKNKIEIFPLRGIYEIATKHAIGSGCKRSAHFLLATQLCNRALTLLLCIAITRNNAGKPNERAPAEREITERTLSEKRVYGMGYETTKIRRRQ